MKSEKKALFSSFKFKIFLMIVITIVASSAVTFGFFVSTRSQSGTNDLTTSCFDVAFEEGDTFINLTNAVSMGDVSGQNTTPYSFTLTNNCDLEAAYHVILSTTESSFNNDFIRVSVNKEAASQLSSYTVNDRFVIDDAYTNSYIIKTGSLVKDASITMDIRAWIGSNVAYTDIEGQTWEAEIKVVSTVKDLEDATNSSTT